MIPTTMIGKNFKGSRDKIWAATASASENQGGTEHPSDKTHSSAVHPPVQNAPPEGGCILGKVSAPRSHCSLVCPSWAETWRVG